MARIVTLFGALLLLLSGLAPAEAAISIYYSGPGNAYGWCAGYAYGKAKSCARDQCTKNDGTDCRVAAECASGWSATAFADDPVEGFGASCGMSDAFWARIVALDECIAASKMLCWTDSTFDEHGNTQSKDANHQFDVVYYIQTLLQVRNYKITSTDGQVGAETIAAVKQLQTDLGRTATGRLDDELVYRLFDAVNGGAQLAVVVNRDFLGPKAKEIGDGGFGAATSPPTTTYSEQLAAGPKDARLLALATILATSDTKCTLPALDAEPIGAPSHESWNVQCAEGWYTLIMSGGTRSIITGKSTASNEGSTPSGAKTVTPVGSGTTEDTGGGRDLSVSHPH
ncbi:MAG: peptidoglycan-binding domain-containing protein [Devosia sp.]|nr:peptidoglycan-binding domain-containing protein [Devosia sp.]